MNVQQVFFSGMDLPTRHFEIPAGSWVKLQLVELMVEPTHRHGKFTILMIFTRKDEDFMGFVSFREGSQIGSFPQLLG